MARDNDHSAEKTDTDCLRMLRGREWVIAASLGPDPAKTASDECDIAMDTWLAGRVRVTLRRVSSPASPRPAWRWQPVRAVKIADR